MGGARLNELGAMAEQCPQRHEVRVRTKRGGESSVAGEGLDPLAVEHVTLAPWPMLHG